jgi:hypothetical protein
MKLGSHEEWIEYNSIVLINISKDIGITFRDINSLSILCDFPKISILSFHQIERNFYKINLKESKLQFAIETMNVQEGELFKSLLVENNYIVENHFSNHSSILPDLEDTEVQKFILNLLLSEEFEHFTSKLDKLLVGIQDKI